MRSTHATDTIDSSGTATIPAVRFTEPEPSPVKRGALVGLARWCIAHRRRVIGAWLAIAILTTLAAGSLGNRWATSFSLPGTGSQRAADVLARDFPSQGGDSDTIVWHVTRGTVTAPGVSGPVERLLARVRALPHVAQVTGPRSATGVRDVSPDGATAFAVVDYDRPANQLAANTGRALLDALAGVHVRGLQLAAGGLVVENAEGFDIGPATAVGVLAALVILLITFGSLLAAGMPLLTAALGLATGVALIGLAGHVVRMPSVAEHMALMIGLGVGIDYALFILTRFREQHRDHGDVGRAVIEAMDTSGRAVLLAGATVVIALLGMFVTGLGYLDGLAIASALAVLLTMFVALTLLPAVLSRFGSRMVRGGARPGGRTSGLSDDRWQRWTRVVIGHPWICVVTSLAVMIGLLVPYFALRLDSSDAGNDPAHTSSRQAFEMLARGFGPGFNGPLTLVVPHPGPDPTASLATVRAAVAAASGVRAVTPPRLAPEHRAAVLIAYPTSAPQAPATTRLVNTLRRRVLPMVRRRTGLTVLVGGVTASSVDFAQVLSAKLPLFVGLVIGLSALLLLVIFRSLVVPVQAALMNLLSIGAALGATVAVFQWGWLAGPLGLQRGPIEPWIPVLIFAVVFGLSMDYEVFLISRVRERWLDSGDPSAAIADALGVTGRVITAAAAIMICVFLSFVLGNQRAIKEFGFALAVAVLLDAVLVRCVLLPAVLRLLGPLTWRLPGALELRLPQLTIEAQPHRYESPIRRSQDDRLLKKESLDAQGHA